MTASVAIKRARFQFLFYSEELHVGGPIKHKIKKAGLAADKQGWSDPEMSAVTPDRSW